MTRFLVAALLLSGSLFVIPENAGAGRIASRALVETGQENSTDSALAPGQADFGFERESGAGSFAIVVSGITLTDITLPDGNGLAAGAEGIDYLRNLPQSANGPVVVALNDLVLYAESGDGFSLRAVGPLESLLNGITSAAFLNRLALSSVYDSVLSFPNYPGREIRGQRVVIAEPDSLTLLCFGLAVLTLSRLVRRSSAKAFVFRPRGHRSGPKPSESMSVCALGW